MNAFWDERFAVEDYIYGTEPNAFLASKANLLHPGMRALVPADGEGRNGVWLAGQGLDVVTVDSSAAGISKAERLARQKGVRVERLQADLCAWDWPEGRFDLCVSIFIHFDRATRSKIHAQMIKTLRPGGLILMEAFTVDQLKRTSGGPRQAELLYAASELAVDFAELDILELAEGVTELSEGSFHQGPAATVRLVARAPSPSGV